MERDDLKKMLGSFEDLTRVVSLYIDNLKKIHSGDDTEPIKLETEVMAEFIREKPEEDRKKYLGQIEEILKSTDEECKVIWEYIHDEYKKNILEK